MPTAIAYADETLELTSGCTVPLLADGTRHCRACIKETERRRRARRGTTVLSRALEGQKEG
jgi:hypothetical protein